MLTSEHCRETSVAKKSKKKSTKSKIPSNVVNKALYSRVKAAAKRKFKVYPSAYANAWLVREYKKEGENTDEILTHIMGLD